ncbi:MAG: MFS transporter [Proteobacteria bacterium]|nr:MAG: MFS transporter [Pseudomonadota bacterium]
MVSNQKKYKKELIIVLLILLFITQAFTDIYVSGLPIMAHDFSVSPAQMNQTITYYVYSQAFLFLIIGPISDIFGRKRVIVITLFCSLISTFIIAESSNLNIILIFRIFQAFGSAGVYIVSRLIIKEVYDKEEVLSVTGLFLLGLVLSPALAPVVGAFIIKHLDWRWTFRLLGILLSIFWLLSIKIIKESNNQINTYRSQFNLKTIINNYIHVLCNWLFIRYVLVVGGTFASFYAFISMSSYMYINEYHISEIYYSYLFTIIAIGYLVGNKIMVFYSKRNVGPYQLVLIGIVLGVIVIVLTILSIFLRHEIILFILLITFTGWITRLATAFINPPIQVGVLTIFNDKGSFAVGLLSSLQYVFAAFGSWFVGFLKYEPSMNIIISTIVFTLLTIASFVLLKIKDISA